MIAAHNAAPDVIRGLLSRLALEAPDRVRGCGAVGCGEKFSSENFSRRGLSAPRGLRPSPRGYLCKGECGGAAW